VIKIRVAYVCNIVSGISGAEEQAYQLIPALPKVGLDVHAVSSVPTGAPKSFCVEAKENKFGVPLWYPGPNFTECFLRIKPDIVLQHSMAVDLCRDLIRARNRLGFKLGFRVGANPMENWMVWPIRREPEPYFWYLTHALNNYDFLVAPSAYAKKELSFLYPHTKIEVIPVGIDVDSYIPTDYMKDGILKILGAARHEVNNYFPVVFNAVRKLKNKYDISMRLLSEGTYFSIYQNVIQRYGIDDVVGLTGWVPVEEKIKAFEVSDVVVVPSITHQGVPVSVLEAAAAGSVAIVSDLPVYDEVSFPVRARLDSFTAWYEALKRCIEEPKWAKERIREGLKEVENYRVEKIALRYKQLFEEVLR